MSVKEKITKEMIISDILGKFPHKSQKLAQEITNAGLHCIGCGAATYETLEAGMLGHGMKEEKVRELVGKLNAILEEEMDLETISMTKRAAEKFRAVCEEEGCPNFGLRFADRPGGCSGFEYILDFSEAADENDTVFYSHGVEIHVDRDSLPRLLGCEIDFQEGLNGAGFKISNPNAKGSCSCGKSQAY